MTYDIIHRTIYEYAASVTVSHHAARLEPRVLPHQQTENFSLRVEPTPTRFKPRMDFLAIRSAVSASRRFTAIWKSRPRAA